ncbi:ABC transporter substrate-binding protein [Paenibacillus whitsoniae]|uniref:Extracellular solute-binding protein n=1 Tax=Paenibacillus whitsoniae TaxID=2496558 RepID=A0A430JJS0_9BACL|nr:ABC transporter substrate-binding protein [Paenibacillus whitsoniae]RTE11263.1 extracellular solute-binding protein [Paenibacillus whitsoniae]
MVAPKKWSSKMILLGIGASVLLAGCSSNGSEKPQNVTNGSGSTGELKPYEIVMMFPFNNQPKELQVVTEEINRITKEKMNATVKLVPISFGTWAQQTTVMLAGNEKIDLMYSSVRGSFNNTVALGHFIPLDELIAKYGQNAKKALDEQNPQILNATKVNGKIYGLPNIKDLASDYGVTMRKDLVEKYKIDINSIKTLDDLDAIFKMIKDNEPGVTPTVKYGSTIIDSYVGSLIDPLGNQFGVLPIHGNELKVVNWFETKEYENLLKTVRRWYLAGYIAKDAATDTETKYNLVKAGRGFSWLSSMKPGIEQQETRSTGKEMVSVRLSPPITTTDKITGSSWSIVRSSENPERAMMLLDLLYTNKDLQNLFSWGVEGKHYVKKGDVIDFPEGVNASNSGYNLQQGYMFGNQFLSYIWNGDDPQLWDKMSKFNKSAVISRAIGFSFNAEPVKTEIAAANNVINQFRVALETGMLDPESKLPEFNKQLKAAGLDKIIAEKQKQLDEWAKSNK